MGWTALILALIEVFGPALIEWLRSLLEDTSRRMPPVDSYGTEHAARDALFDAAREAVPRWRFVRRTLILVAKRHARTLGVTSATAGVTLTPEMRQELEELASAVQYEPDAEGPQPAA